MTDTIAFIGDIHGSITALEGIQAPLEDRGVERLVFLGDYINKGPDSAAVLRRLIELREQGRATLLRGNHEQALLDMIETAQMTTFLKMGGAMTIRSYVGKAQPRVLEHFKANFPHPHLAEIRSMQERLEAEDFVACHVPGGAGGSDRFAISAHVPVGKYPVITDRSASLDTGCGEAEGRLTALMWPSREYLQVDANGDLCAASPD